MIYEILLMGLVVVVVYLLSHQLTMMIEQRWKAGLGAWRSGAFFVIFLVLLLLASTLVRGFVT